MKPVDQGPAKRKRGGQISVYSQELAAEICRRVSNGETLREVCRTPGMPPESTVRWWYSHNLEGFAALYAQARQSQVEAWADELVAISQERDSEPNDRRVRIDTKRWLMSKLVPKKFGDRIVHAGDQDAPIQHVVGVLELDRLSGPELDALERFTEARLPAISVAENEDSKGSGE
jgi:Bacteriophage Sf6, terminase small subunit-like